jgi:hypothetical protein
MPTENRKEQAMYQPPGGVVSALHTRVEPIDADPKMPYHRWSKAPRP